MNKRENRGITLIALIITIIVMLVLVGVTVNVALNGNLFKNAQDASEGTEKARIDEEIQAMIVSEYDAVTGLVNLESLATKTKTINGIEGVDISKMLTNKYIEATDKYERVIKINDDGSIGYKPYKMTGEEASQIFEYKIYENECTIEILKNECRNIEQLRIPDVIDGYKVTKLGLNNGNIMNAKYIYSKGKAKKIILPKYITELDNAAFACFSDLVEIEIPEGVSNIKGNAFNGCTGLTSITIPNSVTIIENSAFSGCTSLEQIVIPNSVVYLGSVPTGLTSITIPNSVTTIGDSAFLGCIELTSIDIPDSVTTIGDSAFSGCTSLEQIVIPNTVTALGPTFVFSGCTNLRTVVLPQNSNITTIGAGFFKNCTSLIQIAIPNNITGICTTFYPATDYVFAGCNNLSKVIIDNTEGAVKKLSGHYTTSETYTNTGENFSLEGVEVEYLQ